MGLLWKSANGRVFLDLSRHRRFVLGQCFAGFRVFQLWRLRFAYCVMA